MMHAPIDTYRFVAAPFHVDFMQKLSMGVLGKHLLNCADSYASDRGFDVAVQHGEHYTWVLSRLAIEWEDMPRQTGAGGTWANTIYGCMLFLLGILLFAGTGRKAPKRT